MRKIHLILLVLLVSGTSFAQEYFGTTTFGAPGIDINYHSAMDSQGNIYTAGLYQSTLTVGSETITSHGGNADGFLTKHSEEATPQWVKGFGGLMDDIAVDVAVDTDDNIYLTGYFQGAGVNAFDADPGPDEFLLSQQSAFVSRDCFIIKLDPNGDFIWAKQVSNPQGVAAEDSSTIEVDTDGNVYVAGRFAYADFNPSTTEEEILFSTGNGAAFDGFILKLDTDGNFIWVKTLASAGHVHVNDMELDANGDILITGSFEQTIDLDPSAGTAAFTSNGAQDTYMAKLSSDGNYIWGQAFGGTSAENVRVITSIDNEVYVGGLFSGTTDLDPSTGTNTVTPVDGFDGYLSKFDTDGNYAYSYIIGGDTTSQPETVYSVRKGGNGNIYISGNYLGTVDFDNGSGEAFSTSNGLTDNYIVEINPDGTYVSHIAFGGADAESNAQLEFNAAGDIISFGAFKSANVNFNPLGDEDLHSSTGNNDVYVSRFNLEPTAGVADLLLEQIKVFPNPVKNVLSVNSPLNEIESYAIINSLGQTVLEGTLNENNIQLNTLTNGVYFLQLRSDAYVFTKKIIKE